MSMLTHGIPKFVLTVGKCRGFCQGMSMFLVSATAKKKKKNAEAIKFFGILRKYVSKNNIILFKYEKKCSA